MSLCITLDREAAEPLFQQIADRLRAAMTAGQLLPGTRLPAARTLANSLRVARGTVDAAYALLSSEGAVVSRGGGGTVVAGPARDRVRSDLTPYMFDAQQVPARQEPVLFRPGLPALDAFPVAAWTRRMARQAPAALTLADPAGLVALRDAIAEDVRIHRGISGAADQVVVTAGFQGALSLVRSVLLNRGDAAWIEDPGYAPARLALEAGGIRVVPVRVDKDGLRVASGLATAPKAKLALVTPANHYPSGAVLSLPRRLELLNWAGTHDSWVLEDDYDSAFRYAGRPVPALKSLDQARRVLFAGSFSKTLFPGLRLGYLIVPPELVDAFRRASRLQSQGQPAQPQAALAAFMVSGQFGAHVRRMRRLYAERRGALMDALRVAFGGRCVLEAPAGGLHILVRFPDLADDTMLARRAAGAGLGALALSSLAIAHHQGQGLLLAFTNIPSNEAEAAVTRLKTAIDAA